MRLDTLEPTTKKRKRVGRGGSRGGTSGRGHNGQRSRAGGKSRIGSTFEGGQMPLTRRIPRRGFTHLKNVDYELVNIGDLEKLFESDQEVTREVLIESGLVKGRRGSKIKLLASGDLSKTLTVKVDAASKTAQEAVESAGGTITLMRG